MTSSILSDEAFFVRYLDLCRHCIGKGVVVQRVQKAIQVPSFRPDDLACS
jgi:hypothetical protein